MLKAWVDRFSFFDNDIQLAGWAFASDKSVAAIDLVLDGDAAQAISHINCPSPDVEAHFGPAAANARFYGTVRLPGGVGAPLNAVCDFVFAMAPKKQGARSVEQKSAWSRVTPCMTAF